MPRQQKSIDTGNGKSGRAYDDIREPHDVRHGVNLLAGQRTTGQDTLFPAVGVCEVPASVYRVTSLTILLSIFIRPVVPMMRAAPLWHLYQTAYDHK